MGMCAEILAIGPFHPDLVKHLEYSEEMYQNTKISTPVVVSLFGIVEGSSLSREFAALLGLTDPWDFNQHKIDKEKVNRKGLMDFVEAHSDYARDLEALLVFVEHDFDFYFLPNG